MSTEDGERSGRPKDVVTDENIKKINKMILNKRKLKLNEIADTPKISTESSVQRGYRASLLLTKNNDELMIWSSV
ncbi:hypothetical protein GWI33_019845 [Rhynchophorus ferrugineus]|uniref:Uncharacterized protein n=1 Tax=Rhynchophorus ferrugineus TaxID=354439 RepID=A0A834HS03_RHYFE|nr:hypothetical protein GWI33_019845 [Rhynchophorus ferrugineus]